MGESKQDQEHIKGRARASKTEQELKTNKLTKSQSKSNCISGYGLVRIKRLQKLIELEILEFLTLA